MTGAAGATIMTSKATRKIANIIGLTDISRTTSRNEKQYVHHDQRKLPSMQYSTLNIFNCSSSDCVRVGYPCGRLLGEGIIGVTHGERVDEKA